MCWLTKNIFALALPYAVFHKESERKYENNLKIILLCHQGPECGSIAKTSIFVISGTFWGFLWLSLTMKNLEKLINTDLDHWNIKISLVVEIQLPEALNQHKNTKNKPFRIIISGFTSKL
jgi:hypothetical protein